MAARHVTEEIWQQRSKQKGVAIEMSRKFLLIVCTGVTALSLVSNVPAEQFAYQFRGHFVPTDRSSTGNAFIETPTAVVGVPFVMRVSWSASVADYSSDSHGLSDSWGRYLSPEIELQLKSPDFEFAFLKKNSTLEIRNDATVRNVDGAPGLWGDQWKINSSLEQLIVFDNIHPIGQPPEVTYPSATEYLVALDALDTSGQAFTTDSLQTAIDFNQFDDVRFEFQQLVPQESGVPRAYQHWLGSIDSIQRVPEPATGTMILVAFCLMYGSRKFVRRDV